MTQEHTPDRGDAPDQAEQARTAIAQLWKDKDATNRLFPENDSRVKTSLLKAARKAIRKHNLNYRDTVRLVNRQRIDRLQDRRPGKRYGTWYFKQDFINLWEKDDPFNGHVDVSNAEVTDHGLYVQDNGILWPARMGEDTMATESPRAVEDDERTSEMDVQSTQPVSISQPELPNSELLDAAFNGEHVNDHATVNNATSKTSIQSESEDLDSQRLDLTKPSETLDLEIDSAEIPAAIQTLTPETQVSSTAMYLLCDALCTSQTRVIDPLYVSVQDTELHLTLKPLIYHHDQHGLIVVPLHHPGHWTVGFVDLRLRQLAHYDSLASDHYTRNGKAALRAFALFYATSLPSSDARTTDWTEETISAYKQTHLHDSGIAITVAALCTSSALPVPSEMDCNIWRRLFHTMLHTIHLPSSSTPTPTWPLPDLHLTDNLPTSLGKLDLPSTLTTMRTLREHERLAWATVTTLRSLSVAGTVDETRHRARKAASHHASISLADTDTDLLALSSRMAEMQRVVAGWIRVEHGFGVRKLALEVGEKEAVGVQKRYLKAAKGLRVRVGLELARLEEVVRSVGEGIRGYDATI